MPDDLPRELRPPLQPMVIAKPPLGMDTRLKAYLDEELIGLSKSSLEDLREMATAIPYEHALVVLARLAARVYSASANVDEHLEIASEVFAGTNVLTPIRTAVAQNNHLVIFSEQLIFLLMRILIELAPERGLAKPATLGESDLFLRALLATSGVSAEQTRENFDETDPNSWIGTLVQHGEFSAKSDFILDRVREKNLLAAARELGPSGTRNFVDLDALHLEATGLTEAEQMRLGLALAATTHAFDDGVEAGLKAHVSQGALVEAVRVAGLEEKHDIAIAAICASRDEFLEQFSEFDAATSEMDSLLWETRQWKTKPFLLLPEGGALLLSPRFLRSWLSEGFYHRPLTAAYRKDPRISGKITRLYGETYEAHCLKLAEDALATEAAAVVSGDDDYVVGPSGKTPDVIIEIGRDLVLIEVSHSSISAPTLVTGDLSRTLKELRSKLVGKINELGRNAKRVLAGDAATPAEPTKFRRVWPVVVSAALPIQTPNLALLLEAETLDLARDGVMQPLTLLDPADYEALMGLVERGQSLVGILEMKTTPPFHQYDLHWWAANDVRAPKLGPRPASMEAGLEDDWRDLLTTASPHFPDLDGRTPDELFGETRRNR